MKFLSTIVALFLLNNLFAYEFLGEVILDNRYFLNEGTSYQDKIHSSFSYSPEIFHEEEDYIFHLKPKIRKDSQDPKRNLLDLQDKLKKVKEVPNTGPKNVTNALFVGSTTELQKMLKDKKQ